MKAPAAVVRIASPRAPERRAWGWGPTRTGEEMTLFALALSAAAFVYLVYAMLRPERF